MNWQGRGAATVGELVVLLADGFIALLDGGPLLLKSGAGWAGNGDSGGSWAAETAGSATWAAKSNGTAGWTARTAGAVTWA